ncbi:flagellum-specific ATP synthase [Microbacterium sp. AG157]|uniref:FliI/YscN family ATPase n=1 Tax=Microbacterium TaxID=33882 RepID=UPI000CCE9C4C|nr:MULTISPECIES: FliI/YscN family ATPase [Microbacterium]PNW07874.1 EscN/YscN/HrcN family type III secretion system ATPase [Microbacterium testaceum]REC99455.1 flagellum-specific ATP synthase [Microbacterium sp. AG157]WJS91826.1 FliI/YscN family ATPase [Microbacterium testaceum]
MSVATRRWERALRATGPRRSGVVKAVVGLGVEALGIPAAVGDRVRIEAAGAVEIEAEVVAVDGEAVRCMPMGPMTGVRVGAAVHHSAAALTVPTGRGLLGRVLDGLGRPIDGLGPLTGAPVVALDNTAPSVIGRQRIDRQLGLGVRALDTMTPVGVGQRLGLFAGSGVGKSSLMSMIARGSTADVTVIALVGERGREVREFLEDDLGPEGLARAVVVVATSDQPAMARLRSAFVATRIAEQFRDDGLDVVLMMDSLTRVAMAQREIGLSAGEPPATRGYPPSTFSVLAGLLERAGTGPTGSITGLYTVLVDGDDHNEPVADAARGILDGHVVLDRGLAVRGHFPAIDVLGSVSRVVSKVTTPDQRETAVTLRRVLAARRQANDLIDIGAYKAGANPLVDAALAHQGAIDGFLTQRMDDLTPTDDSWRRLTALTTTFGGLS